MAWVRKHAPETNLKFKGFRLGEELSLAIHEALKPKKTPELPVANSNRPSLMDQLKTIELQLHSHIKRRLQERYGTQNDDWWYEGIPEVIRSECVQRRDQDRGRHEAFNYTYLIDLKTVLDKNWLIFESDFGKIRNFAISKKDFLDQITKLNGVRNRYFHPIRAPRPGSKVAVDDDDFVLKMSRVFATFCNYAQSGGEKRGTF